MEDNKNEEIQEMQILDQNLHNILLQKQAFDMELSETKSALKEIDKSDEIFKLVGELMIKSNKEKVKEELSTKEKVLGMRIKSIEKQEDALSKRLDELRNKFSNIAK
jgi:prefoldin beta subunit